MKSFIIALLLLPAVVHSKFPESETLSLEEAKQYALGECVSSISPYLCYKHVHTVFKAKER